MHCQQLPEMQHDRWGLGMRGGKESWDSGEEREGHQRQQHLVSGKMTGANRRGHWQTNKRADRQALCTTTQGTCSASLNGNVQPCRQDTAPCNPSGCSHISKSHSAGTSATSVHCVKSRIKQILNQLVAIRGSILPTWGPSQIETTCGAMAHPGTALLPAGWPY